MTAPSVEVMPTTAQQSSTTPSAARTPGTRALAWAVLAAAVLEVVAPAITLNGPGSSPDAGSGPELLITPAGWAFSIWGVIYALAIAQAIGVLAAGAEHTSRRLQVAQLVLYVGGAVWIAVAGVDSVLATAAVLVVMAVAATLAVLTVATLRGGPDWLRLLSRAAVGLYAGWVTAAVFLNVSTALAEVGPLSVRDTGWQVVALALSALALLVVTVLTGAVVTYPLAGAWAMLGISVTAAGDGTTAVLVTAVVSGLLLLATLVAVRAGGRGRAG